MARAASVRQTFKAAAERVVERTRDSFIALAKREHAEVMATEPRPAIFRRIVDGREGAREEDVRSGGIIVYQYPRLSLVVEFALETLRELSPVLTGAYRNAHTIYLNGAPVADIGEWDSGMPITIANPLPYSRKIELDRMTMRLPGSSMVYQRAVRRVNARYGNLAKVTFSFRAVGAKVQGKDAPVPSMTITER